MKQVSTQTAPTMAICDIGNKMYDSGTNGVTKVSGAWGQKQCSAPPPKFFFGEQEAHIAQRKNVTQ